MNLPQRTSLFVLFGLLFCTAVGTAKEPTTLPQVPGSVIAHSPAASNIYLGSPAIAILNDGRYVAKCDLFGPGAPKENGPITRVFQSSDRGATWKHVTDVPRMFWASIFVHRNDLYMLGVGGTNHQVVLRKSIDGGDHWSDPVDADTGLLLADGRYHCAPVPVIEHAGRLWRGMEDTRAPGGWGTHFRSFVMSAPSDADLLNASSWTYTNRLSGSPEWLAGEFGGWLEGNAVVAPNGNIVNLLRVHYMPGGGKGAMIHVSADGTKATFDPSSDFLSMPGGCKKFTIRFDPRTKKYWSLTNLIPEWDRGGNPERTRNTIALVCSTDLRTWTARCIVLYHPDLARHGFQYVDWIFDGDDLVAVSRTAYDDAEGGAHNQHDANFLTFHRIGDFRHLTMSDSTPLPDFQAERVETRDFTVTGFGFQAVPFENGQTAYRNRDYVWEKIPPRFRNWLVTQTAGGVLARLTVTAKQECNVLIATADNRATHDLPQWEKLEGITFHYDDRTHTRMALYRRHFTAGQHAMVPQYSWTGTLVLMPRG